MECLEGLEGLEELFEKDTEKAKQITDAIKYIPYKYSNVKLDTEDFRQELWIVALQLLEKGKPAGYIVKSLWNRAITMYREQKKKPISMLMPDEYVDDYMCGRKDIDRIVIKDFVERYPTGSLERQYLLYKLLKSEDISEEEAKELGLDLIKIPVSEIADMETDEDIAEVIGCKNVKTLSKKKQKMKSDLRVYIS